MAGRLLVMTNTDTQIQGNCEAENYTNFLKLDNASFTVGSSISPGEQTGEVYQSGIEITVPMGPWLAELEAALYAGKTLGSVTITELAQAQDTNNAKTWKKVRELTLTDGWIEAMSMQWSSITTSCIIVLQYTDISFTWADKVAHYNRSEKT